LLHAANRPVIRATTMARTTTGRADMEAS
jgi:hypothetical protein